MMLWEKKKKDITNDCIKNNGNPKPGHACILTEISFLNKYIFPFILDIKYELMKCILAPHVVTNSNIKATFMFDLVTSICLINEHCF